MQDYRIYPNRGSQTSFTAPLYLGNEKWTVPTVFLSRKEAKFSIAEYAYKMTEYKRLYFPKPSSLFHDDYCPTTSALEPFQFKVADEPSWLVYKINTNEEYKGCRERIKNLTDVMFNQGTILDGQIEDYLIDNRVRLHVIEGKVNHENQILVRGADGFRRYSRKPTRGAGLLRRPL